MKTRIGKIIKAITTGTLLLGSTLGGAYATADLANFPNQFVKDGKFNGVMVIGDKAAAEDVIGLSDIAISLQFAAVEQVNPSKTVVKSTPDAWKVGTSSKNLEISENLENGSLTKEAISDVISGSYISEPELEILSDGEVRNNKGVFPYHQRLYFEDAYTGYVIYTEDDDDTTADFLFFDSEKNISKYELEFTTALESDVEDSTGSAVSTGTILGDLEDVELNILGKPYTVVQAKRLSTTGNNVGLTLMGGSARDTLMEKETKTFDIEGIDYEVTLNFVDGDDAQFVVNGESTRKLKDGDTDKLSDGITIGVTDILYQDYAGGVHSATFFLGANKLELKDTSVIDSASSNVLKVDDKTIDNANVIIEATDDNSTFKINRINVVMEAEDDLYIPAGKSLSGNPQLDEPEVIFTQNWDIHYAGLSKELTNEIKIKSSGSDQYKLEFMDWGGQKVSVPLAHSNSTAVKLGDDDNSLVFNESKVIVKDDYFVVTDGSDAAGEKPTYVLRYRGADKDTADNKVLKFDDLGTGGRMEISYSSQGDASTLATLKIGGGSYPIRANPQNEATTDNNDFGILVDLNQDGFGTNSTIPITTNYGAQIGLTDGTPGSINISISTPNTNHFDNVVPSQLNFSIGYDSDGDVDMNKASGGLKLFTPENEDDTSYGYTSYGSFVRFDNPTTGEASLEIVYPRQQLMPQVYIKSKNTEIGNSLKEDNEKILQKIDVGAARLASEVQDIKAQNTILVGGPCANAAAATIMGNPADCVAGFEPGTGKVELFEHLNGNVAMLVAGYSALDTRTATSVIADYKRYKEDLKGTKLEIKKVSNKITVVSQ